MNFADIFTQLFEQLPIHFTAAELEVDEARSRVYLLTQGIGDVPPEVVVARVHHSAIHELGGDHFAVQEGQPRTRRHGRADVLLIGFMLRGYMFNIHLTLYQLDTHEPSRRRHRSPRRSRA